MGTFIYRVKLTLAYIVYLPLLIKYKYSSESSIIDQDVDRWIEEVGYKKMDVSVGWFIFYDLGHNFGIYSSLELNLIQIY